MKRFYSEIEESRKVQVEIFRTEVQNAMEARELISVMHDRYPDHKINFDLEDCDRIFRMEGGHFCPEEVVNFFAEYGYKCELMR